MAKAKKRKKSMKHSKRSGRSILSGRDDRPIRKETRGFFLVSPSDKKGKESCLFSENVSLTGVFLETPNPFPPGSKVKLRFPPRSPYASVQIKGTVVWSREKFAFGNLGNESPGMGIVFDKIQKKDLRKLKQFLNNIPTSGWFLEDSE